MVVLFEVSGHISYIVGSATLQQDSSLSAFHGIHMDWGKVQNYGDGCNVQAALNENDDIVVVRSRVYRRECMYRVGKVDHQKRCISWREEIVLAKGANPTLALNEQTLLFVYEAEWGQYRCSYEVCRLECGILWAPRSSNSKANRLSALDDCKEISVAMNKTSRVIFSCRSNIGSNLYCAVGDLVDTCLLNVYMVETPYSNGYYSHIALLDSGLVVSVHQNSLGSIYMTGHLQDKAIKWWHEKELGSGFKPSVGVSNDKKLMIIVRTDESAIRAHGELKYKLGWLSTRLD